MQVLGAEDGHLVRAKRESVSLADIARAVTPAPVRALGTKVLAWAMVTGCLAGAVSLATWTASDPSMTFAHGGETENWLGFWGASFSDLSMQFLGFASIALVALPLVWALHVLTNRTMPLFGQRALFAALGICATTAALGCIAVPDGWPLRESVGLGGVVGDAWLSIPRAFLGTYPNGMVAVLLFVVCAVPATYCLARAANLHRGIAAKNASREIAPPMDDQPLDAEEESAFTRVSAASIGWLLHFAYVVGALFRKRHVAPVAAPPARTSPIFDLPPLDAPQDDAAPLMPAETQAEPLVAPVFADPILRAGVAVAPEVTFTPTGDATPVGNPDTKVSYAPSIVVPRAQVEAAYDAPVVPGAVPEPAAAPTPPAPTASVAAPVAPTVARRAMPSLSDTFELPALDLLSEERNLVEDPSLSNEVLAENAAALESVLDDFGVKGSIIKVRPGPVVTLYELEPAPGVKSSRVIGLAEDIARSMSAIAARVAVVPGRNAIGIELPNKKRETVYLRQQLAAKEFVQSKMKLPMCLGKDIGGAPVIADMAKMPHLLVAGTTGSGKSVAINTMILSLIYKHSPETCKLIMIDPKMLELSIYDGIPHLLTPVVVDPKKAVVALKWTVREMEDRYRKMSKVGVRNIDGFNTRIKEAAEKGETIARTVQTGFDRDTGEAIYETEELELEALPYIVVIIDEMADLMMVAGKDIEGTVQRLAQMARAAGIHVIMATQRPSTDVITGTIKANFPTRISFQVTSKIDSRVMLGESGAEQLLGMGDMLYMAGGGRITRVHGPFVDDHEVEDVVNHLKTQGVPQYLEGITDEDEEGGDYGDDASGVGSAGPSGNGNLNSGDEMYDQAVAIVLRDRKASTSYIQRRLSVGYNKAASLIERMEQEGLISPANHAGKRDILVPGEEDAI